MVPLNLLCNTEPSFPLETLPCGGAIYNDFHLHIHIYSIFIVYNWMIYYNYIVVQICTIFIVYNPQTDLNSHLPVFQVHLPPSLWVAM